ncbi:MAG: threonine synthase [Clostridia bacterium]|nr:threonine synthase [Clostridia bacterium]
MDYVSTRNEKIRVSSSFAITHGIAADGGLFIPVSIPSLSDGDFSDLRSMSYVERAAFVLKKYLPDFSDEEIEACVKGAYTDSFDNNDPAPLAELGADTRLIELWHGPTCAFKDLALQLLPYLMTTAAKHEADGKKIVILVATSGDTGKAALEGFKDVDDTEIIVFYPSDGVSRAQKLQMATQEGKNVHVYGIVGNFDDAQTGVKQIFNKQSVVERFAANGYEFSSANSINWGRLVPQIVYYISAYCDMLNEGADLSHGFNITVPTGNFGNILAAYFAKAMGVPVNKLICASNKNKILTDFINTGKYDKNREFYTTISPSMDILISSNLERMLYILSDEDEYVRDLQFELLTEGRFEVGDDIKRKMSEIFYGGYCDDDKTRKTIASLYREFGYLCDTHTAVAVTVANEYKEKTGDNRPMVIASTASPYKFTKSVLLSLGSEVPDDEFEAIEKLNSITGVAVPTPISSLSGKAIRFKDVIDKSGIENAVYSALNL